MFRRKTKSPPAPPHVSRPINGMVVRVMQTGDKFWLLNGKVYSFLSPRAYDTWGFKYEYPVDQRVVDSLPRKGGRVGFRDGSLIQDVVSGKMYLVSDSKTRLITSPDVVEALGRDRVIVVSQSEAEFHKEGEPLNGI